MEISARKRAFSDNFIPAITGIMVFSGLFLSSFYNFLLFHTLSELFSITVAFAIFMLIWNSRRYLDGNYLQFVGIAYFFVGTLDLLHLVSYKGIGIFRGYDANLPTQLWIAGRYVQSISLFIASFFITRRLRYTAMFSLYTAITALLIAAVFAQVFPTCYVEGSGLTLFKVTSEYLISFILVCAMFLLLRNREHFEKSVLKLMAWSIAFTIGAELAFTFYVSVYGLSNLLGHYFKIISYYLTYRAIIVTGLTRPYDLLFRELKHSEEDLRQYRDRLEELVEKRTVELKRANEELGQEIRERREIENHITIRNAFLNLLSGMSSRKEYLDAAVKLVRDWSGCRCAGIRMLDKDGNIPYESYTGFSSEFWESESNISVKHDQCACTRVITGKAEPQDAPLITPFGSFCCNNIVKFTAGLSGEEQKRFRGVCVRSGFASIGIVPVRYRDEIIAAVHLADEREGMLPDAFMEFFESITPLIGEAINKLNAEAERTRLAAAVESSADAIAITDTTWIVQYINAAFAQVTGYGGADIVGQHLGILREGSSDQMLSREIGMALKQGRAWSGRLTSRRKDGRPYEEDVTISPVRNTAGEIVNYIATKRDITEKLRLESIAEAVNTMNNVGYIIAGVRHEIGNPVNSVKMTLNILKLNLNKYDHAAIREYIERSLAELSRIEYLLKSLKSFNMYENPELRNLQVAPFMEKLLALIRDDFSGRGISVALSAGGSCPVLCYADPRALQQVLLNILTNAADACESPEGGKILIEISGASGIIRMRITDNGRGMPEEQLRNLFKPFYTTKKHGTGLGLILAKKMLAKMNGTIAVSSGMHKGTAVDICIPEGRIENSQRQEDRTHH